MKNLIALFALFITSISFGEPPQSNFFYQTTQGAHYTSITALTKSASLKLEGSGETITSTSGLELFYEFGYLKNFAYGAKIGYLISDVDSGQNTKGMTDLTMHGVSFYKIDDVMSLHYGIAIAATLGERNSIANQVDATSGGSTLTPFLGWHWTYAINSFGIKIEPTLFSSERKTLAATGNTLEKGGNSQVVSLYHEWPTQSGYIGAIVRHTHTDSTQNSTSGVSISNNNATDIYNLELTTSHKLSSTYTLTPTIGYSRYLNKDIGGAKIESDSNMWVRLSLEISPVPPVPGPF